MDEFILNAREVESEDIIREYIDSGKPCSYTVKRNGVIEYWGYANKQIV